MPLKMKVYVIIWSIPENGGLWSEERIGRYSALAVLRVKMTAGQWMSERMISLQTGITEELVL